VDARAKPGHRALLVVLSFEIRRRFGLARLTVAVLVSVDEFCILIGVFVHDTVEVVV
jgi:hypothetical protein